MLCQGNGHAEYFRTQSPRCVKCDNTHLTKYCASKSQDDNVKSANWKKNHTENYRLCEIHQQLCQKHLPTSFHLHEATSIAQVMKTLPIQAVKHEIFYAQMVKRQSHHEQFDNQTTQSNLTTSPTPPADVLIRLENMKENFMDRIRTVIDFIIRLLSKMH